MQDAVVTAEQLQERALAVGLTIDQLMGRAGLSKTVFYRWKAGSHSPRLGNYQRMLRVVVEAERGLLAG